MSAVADIRAALRRLAAVPDPEIDLLDAALWFAALDRPRAPREPYRRHVERIADDVAAYVIGIEPELELRAEALAQIIARRYGYGREIAERDGPDGANLMTVIDRRRGLPVAIGVLYLHVAHLLGWTMVGLDFPGRFLVRLEHVGRRMILDPAGGGRRLEPVRLRALLRGVAGPNAALRPPHYRAMDNRQVLVRLQNSLKSHWLAQQKPARAASVIEAMLLFAPDVAPLWRELGLLRARLGDMRAAVAAIETYLATVPGDLARYRASLLLQKLRGRLATETTS